MGSALLEVDAKRTPAHVVVADDNESTLAAVVRFLTEENYQVVGQATDGIELISATVRLAPDVAVVDVSMPGLSGLDATAQLKKMNCGTKIIMLTVHSEPEFLRAAFAAGATGYVLKHRLVTDLSSAIELALRGQRFISPPLAVPAE